MKKHVFDINDNCLSISVKIHQYNKQVLFSCILFILLKKKHIYVAQFIEKSTSLT